MLTRIVHRLAPLIRSNRQNRTSPFSDESIVPLEAIRDKEQQLDILPDMTTHMKLPVRPHDPYFKLEVLSSTSILVVIILTYFIALSTIGIAFLVSAVNFGLML